MKDPASAAALGWGTETYLPRQTSGGKWCTSFSFDDAADPKTCKLNTQLVSAVVISPTLNVPNL